MANFNIFGSSTTAQTLASGETGYVGPNGALVAASGYAIDASGSFGLTVLGSVSAQTASAISLDRLASPPDTDRMIISIGAMGQITSLKGSAIVGEVTHADLTVQNNGLLSGTSEAIRLYDYLTTSIGELRVINTGTIIGGGIGAIYHSSDALGAYVANSGTIAALAPGGNAINLGGQGSELHNSGTITGNVDMFSDAVLVNSGLIDGKVFLGSSGSDPVTVQNTGTILGELTIETAVAHGATVVTSGLINGAIVLDDGDDSLQVVGGTVIGTITLGNGNDDFTLQGARVTGTVDGGLGEDTYRIDSAIDIIDSGGIEDTVYASVTFALGLGLERLALTGSGDIRGSGNGSANSMVGNAGDNRISGQGGTDTMSGGFGDDTLRGGSGNDQLLFDPGDDSLLGGSGIDLFNLAGSLTAFLVDLSAGIASSEAADDDILSGIENVQGGLGADTITGSSEANSLRGSGGGDVLRGGGGADTLTGEAGADTLTGGNGADQFRFERLSDSPDLGPDTISDFNVAQGDLIDLSLIDANALGAGNGAFLFSTSGFLPEGAPSVRVTQDVGNTLTIIEARDSVGAGVDLRIVLTGLLALTADSFIL